MSKVNMMSAKDKKKGSLVPRLRFPEFRDAGEWQESFLGEYSGVVRGGSPRPIDNFLTIEKDGLNWLKIGDIDKEAKYVVATSEKVRAEALNKTREISPSDLILSNSMSFGRPYISKIKTCIHDGWIAITKISKKLLTDYIYYLISSPSSQHYFTSNAAGSGVQNLNADIIKALPIFFPSVLEQQKIADCLSSLDESIAAETNKLDALKAHKKGLLKQLFPAEGETLPALRFPKFRNAGEWEKSTVNDLLTESCQIGSKGNKAKKLTVKLWGKGVFEKEETFQGSVNTQYYRRRSGQFIYSKLDFLNQAFGIIPHYLDGFESTVDLPCFDFRSDVNPIFFLEYVKREAFYKKFGEIADGGRKAKRIQVDVFLSFPVLLPPQTKEQQQIADCLSSLDELITAQGQKIELLKDHKKGLMQQLFPRIDEVLA